jgi:hypothetical protein
LSQVRNIIYLFNLECFCLFWIDIYINRVVESTYNHGRNQFTGSKHAEQLAAKRRMKQNEKIIRGKITGTPCMDLDVEMNSILVSSSNVLILFSQRINVHFCGKVYIIQCQIGQARGTHEAKCQ